MPKVPKIPSLQYLRKEARDEVDFWQADKHQSRYRHSHANWKALINGRLRVSKVSWKFCISVIYNFAIIYPWEVAIFLKSSLLFQQPTFPAGNYMFKVKYRNTRTRCEICSKLTIKIPDKTLRFNNLKNRTATNANVPVLVMCVKAIIYLLLYNLHDWTFKYWVLFLFSPLHQTFQLYLELKTISYFSLNDT